MSPLSIRIASVSLVASVLAFAACSNGGDPGGGADLGASQHSSSRHNAPNPGDEVLDSKPTFKPTDFLNSHDSLFKGLKKADFKTTGYKTKSAGSASLKDYDTPIRNQGSRGWCTAFAQVAAIENLVKHNFGDALDLSEIDHWDHYQEYSIYSSATAAKSQFIVPETSWPYNGSPISGYESTAIAKLASYKELGSSDEVFAALRAGHPVVVGLDVNDSWNSVGSDGRVYPGGSVLGGHALEVVGYQDDASWGGGGYMTIKNSWGSKWGDRGYVHVPYDYCSDGSCYFLEMTAADYKGHSPTPPPPPTPDAGPAPTPDAGPAPPPPPPPPPPPSDDAGPAPTPGAEPTAWDIDCIAEKDPAHPDRFKVKLYGHHPTDLAQVAQVTYDVDESFGAYEYWTVDLPKDDFAVPFYYRTWAHHWQTNGAVVTLKSGTVLYLAGAPIDW